MSAQETGKCQSVLTRSMRACTFAVVDELTRLAHAARLGERGAIEAFIEASYGEVWRLCAALADAGAADDLTQETYVRCVPALRRFRGDASARTWLLSIARRVCMDELRSRARRRRSAGVLDDAQALVVPDAAADVAVADLVVRLSPDRRAAFVLTQLFRLSYQEAALVCGCPVGTIRSRVARAREDLVAMIAESKPARGDGRQVPGRQHGV
jgi:RNA polymerase sigma-70 factor (ECF subfamily)